MKVDSNIDHYGSNYKPKRNPSHYTDEYWRNMPLFTWPAGQMRTCPRPEHGEWDPHAYFNDDEIAEMMANDEWDCPLCLIEICDQDH